MITDKDRKNMSQFYNAVLALRDEEECRKFFDDVATIFHSHVGPNDSVAVPKTPFTPSLTAYTLYSNVL